MKTLYITKKGDNNNVVIKPLMIYLGVVYF